MDENATMLGVKNILRALESFESYSFEERLQRLNTPKEEAKGEEKTRTEKGEEREEFVPYTPLLSGMKKPIFSSDDTKSTVASIGDLESLDSPSTDGINMSKKRQSRRSQLKPSDRIGLPVLMEEDETAYSPPPSPPSPSVSASTSAASEVPVSSAKVTKQKERKANPKTPLPQCESSPALQKEEEKESSKEERGEKGEERGEKGEERGDKGEERASWNERETLVSLYGKIFDENHVRTAFQCQDATRLESFNPVTHIYSFDCCMPRFVIQKLVDTFNRSEDAFCFVSFRDDLIDLHCLDAVLQHRATMRMNGSGEGRQAYVYMKADWKDRKHEGLEKRGEGRRGEERRGEKREDKRGGLKKREKIEKEDSVSTLQEEFITSFGPLYRLAVSSKEELQRVCEERVEAWYNKKPVRSSRDAMKKANMEKQRVWENALLARWDEVQQETIRRREEEDREEEERRQKVEKEAGETEEKLKGASSVGKGRGKKETAVETKTKETARENKGKKETAETAKGRRAK